MSDDSSRALQIMLDAKKKAMGGKPAVAPAPHGASPAPQAMSMGERMRQIAGKK